MATKDRVHCFIVRIDGELFDALEDERKRRKMRHRSTLARALLRAALPTPKRKPNPRQLGLLELITTKQ